MGRLTVTALGVSTALAAGVTLVVLLAIHAPLLLLPVAVSVVYPVIEAASPRSLGYRYGGRTGPGTPAPLDHELVGAGPARRP